MWRWKRCKQQTDRKNIVQKEMNAVSLNLNARKRWKWRKTTLERHLVHFYWCLSDCIFSLPLDGIYDAHWACCDVHLIRWGMCESLLTSSLQWKRREDEDEQINSVYAWHYPHFDLQSNLIVRSSVDLTSKCVCVECAHMRDREQLCVYDNKDLDLDFAFYRKSIFKCKRKPIKAPLSAYYIAALLHFTHI